MKFLKVLLVLSAWLMVVPLFLPLKTPQHEIAIHNAVSDLLMIQGAYPEKCEATRNAVRFEPNLGQTNIPAAYIARGTGYRLFLTANDVVLAFQNGLKRIRLSGSNPNPRIAGNYMLQGRTNYFTGNDPKNWITNVPNYSQVEYREVYPGIDLVYYGNEGELEYDFIVKPGGDPGDILLKAENGEHTAITKEGVLIFYSGREEIIMKPPAAYQEIHGKRNPVVAEYVKRGEDQIAFRVGPYDPAIPLIIDPVLVYASYLGSEAYESGEAIAVDTAGCTYVTGYTGSLQFPVKSCFQCIMDPGEFMSTDVFVTKFNAAGTDIVYSTYLGGGSFDEGACIAVDESGRAYLTGKTTSTDDAATPANEAFPLHHEIRSVNTDPYMSDAFVTVLGASGNELIYSTYLGGDGEDYGTGIAIDKNGFAYVSGTNFSFDFPVRNAFMGVKPSYYYDAFVTKINPFETGDNSLVYSSYLGGTGDDYGNSIAVDKEGYAYITGQTEAADFPVTENACQKNRKLNNDVFVTKFTPDGLSLVYSTYLGSDGNDEGMDIKVDTAGNAYLCGYGGDGFPVTPGAFMPSSGYAFLCKIVPDGSGLTYSTHTPFTGCLAINDQGQAFVGSNVSTHANLIAMNPAGSDTLFSLKIIGDGDNTIKDIAVDREYGIYVTGNTSSSNIATPGVYKTTLSGTSDIMVAKFGKAGDLIAQVLQDSLNHHALPIPDTRFELYSLDLANKSNPMTYIGSSSTDNNGLLHLPADTYHPGMPVLIRTIPEKIAAAKKGSGEPGKYSYKMNLDNLNINRNGGVSAQQLAAKANDTTKVYLGHTSLAFDLSVSTEWKVSPDYADKLRTTFSKTSNMLFDVTNGHAYIDQVTFYDDTANWKNADIHMYANNMQTPESGVQGIRLPDDGYVSLPPAMYFSQGVLDLQQLYNATPIDPSGSLFVKIIVHELGHYAIGFFDEYRDPLGTYIYPDVNFGIMDISLDLDDLMSTELSDYGQGDALFDYYMETDHYFFLDRNCWDYFRDSTNKDFGPLLARIHTPKNLGIHPPDVMQGPNNDLDNPDFNVGSMMRFDVKATTTNQAMRKFQMKDQRTGRPLVTKVCLEKNSTNRWIEHGYTTMAGKIKLFNGEAGDRILTWVADKDTWKYCKTVIGNAAKKSSDDEEPVELVTVNGTFTLLSGIAFNEEGEPEYQCQAVPAFSGLPAIRITGDPAGSSPRTLNGSNGKYAAVLADPDFREGNMYFTAPDNAGVGFFTLQQAAIRNVADLGSLYYFPESQIKLSVNQANTTATKISLVTSDFPAPADGLPDLVARVSQVVSMNFFPHNALLDGRIQIPFFTDTLIARAPEALKVYRWNDGWTPLETNVDLVNGNASAAINGSGYYAVFFDLTQNSAITGLPGENVSSVTSGLSLYPPYPNPFNSYTNIRIYVPATGRVTLDVFDLNGRRIVSLVDNPRAAGPYSMIWNGSDDKGNSVPPGVYVINLKFGNQVKQQKLVVLESGKFSY